MIKSDRQNIKIKNTYSEKAHYVTNHKGT